jgi:hypothetical protein
MKTSEGLPIHNTSVAFTVNGPTRYFIGRYDSDGELFKAEYAPTGFVPKHEYFRASDVLWWAYLPGSEDAPAPVMLKPENGREIKFKYRHHNGEIIESEGLMSGHRILVTCTNPNIAGESVLWTNVVDWQYGIPRLFTSDMPELGRSVVFKHKGGEIRVGQYIKGEISGDYWFVHFSECGDGVSRYYEPSDVVAWRYADELWALGEEASKKEAKAFVDELRATASELKGSMPMPGSRIIVTYKDGGKQISSYARMGDGDAVHVLEGEGNVFKIQWSDVVKWKYAPEATDFVFEGPGKMPKDMFTKSGDKGKRLWDKWPVFLKPVVFSTLSGGVTIGYLDNFNDELHFVASEVPKGRFKPEDVVEWVYASEALEAVLGQRYEQELDNAVEYLTKVRGEAVSEKSTSEPGISRRDYFASSAMHAILSQGKDYSSDDVALLAKKVTDALIKKLG